jgi:hypothetical protein
MPPCPDFIGGDVVALETTILLITTFLSSE